MIETTLCYYRKLFRELSKYHSQYQLINMTTNPQYYLLYDSDFPFGYFVKFNFSKS